MPRTYLKNSVSDTNLRKNNQKKPVKVEKANWRATKLYASDEEDDSFRQNLKVSAARSPLSTVDNKLNLDRLGERQQPQDAFDQLFDNVDVNKMKLPKAAASPLSFSSDCNSTFNSDNSDQCYGLFKSFSDPPPPADSQKQRKVSRQRQSRAQKSSKMKVLDRKAAKIKLTNSPEDTLLFELQHSNLVQGSSLLHLESEPQVRSPALPHPCDSPADPLTASRLSDKMQPPLPSLSGLAESPAISLFTTPGSRKTSAMTSTPLISSSNPQDVSLPFSCSGLEPPDEVFLPDPTPPKSASLHLDPNNGRAKSGECGRSQVLSSVDIIPATPQQLVNKSRGKRQFGGPALSLMQHMKWKMTLNPSSTSFLNSASSGPFPLPSPLPTEPQTAAGKPDTSGEMLTSVSGTNGSEMPSSRSNSESVEVEARDLSNSGSLRDIQIACICGVDEEIASCLVICEGCNYYLHSDCVGLTNSNLNDIIDDNLEWFCPRCINNAEEGSLSFTSPRQAEAEKVEADRRTEETGSDGAGKGCSKDEAADCIDNAEPDALPEDSVPKEQIYSSSLLPDTSLLFTQPVAATPAVETAAGEIFLRSGKSWRRSLSTISAAAQARRPSLARRSIVCLPGPAKSVAVDDVDENIFLVPETRSFRSSAARRLSSRQRESATTKTRATISETIQEEEEEEKDEVLDTTSTVSSEQLDRTAVSSMLRPCRSSRHSYSVTTTSGLERSSVAAPAEISILLPQPHLSDLDKLMSVCTGGRVAAFDEFYDEQCLASSRKVGEGAFGEVYLVGQEEQDKPVLKIVPIGGDIKVNEEDQTSLPDIMSEIVISKGLSDLRQSGNKNRTEGFVEVRNCIVFKGAYPPKLLQLWDDFDREKTSENSRPDYLPSDQLYVALEFNNGGKDLEKYEFRHAGQALAAWKQVVHTLAVAESEMHFEHRDLHWGNVLIKESSRKTVDYTLNGDTYSVDTCGIEITIIDFSLSRLTSSVDGCTIYNNLAEDPSLFKALGADRGGDYQFDIYRMMQKENKNSWEEFNPKTNLFWLHYMLEKMITEVYYKKQGKKASRPHKSGLTQLRRLRSNLLEHYCSARDFVIKDGNLLLN